MRIKYSLTWGLNDIFLERQTEQITFVDRVPVREEVFNGFLTTQIRKKGFRKRDERDSQHEVKTRGLQRKTVSMWLLQNS